MSAFYFIGEEELLVAFRLVGVEGRAVTGREEALEAFRLATRGESEGLATRGESEPSGDEGQAAGLAGIRVLILSTGVASLLEAETRDWQFGGDYPLIVEIPSPGSSFDEGRSLVKAIREAVGIRV